MVDNYMNDYLKLIVECGKLIENGIIVEGVKMPFTMIDFYNLVGKDIYGDIDHNEIRELAMKYKIKYKVSNKYLNRFLGFVINENLSGGEISNPMEILNQNYAFIFNDKKYVPTYDDVLMIMNLFDIYNVPKHNRLIYQALHRVARGFPVFPLLIEEDEKKLGR